MVSGKHSRTGRSIVSAVLMLMLVVAATGCLTGDLDVKVNADGGGSFKMEIFPSDDVQKMLVAAGASDAGKSFAASRKGAKFEQKIVDGRVAYKATIPFDDYKTIGRLLMTGVVVNGQTIRVFKSFELTKSSEDKWELRAELAPDLGSDTFTAGPSADQLAKSEGRVPLNSDLRLSVALPGRITHSNARKIDGGRGTWYLRSSDTKANLVMFTEPKPLLTTPQKAFAGAGVAVLLGIFLLVFGSQHSWGKRDTEKKRRKKLKFPGKQGTEGNWQPPNPRSAVAAGSAGGRDSTVLPSMPQHLGGGSPSQPNAPEPSLVAPPVAPVIDHSQPNPFAPHRPGVPAPVDVADADALVHEAEEASAQYASHEHTSPEAKMHLLGQKAQTVHPHDLHIKTSPSLTEIAESVTGPPQTESFGAPDISAEGTVPPEPSANDGVVGYPNVTTDDGGLADIGSALAQAFFPDSSGDADRGEATPVTDLSVPEPVELSVTEPVELSVTEPVASTAPVEPSGPEPVASTAPVARSTTEDPSVEPSAQPSHEAEIVPADWYPDPDDPNRHRWWDGQRWTDFVG